MLLFGFPQETQLDKISPTVLVILIISMASPSRGAFLCLCVPVLSASFPRSLQQGLKGAQRMMKGCSKVAYAFVTLLITYSSAANTFTAQSSFLNFLQRYNKYLKYTRILAIKCNFICILCYKALLFAQLCDCIFGGFLIYKGVPTIQQIFVYFLFNYASLLHKIIYPTL